MTELDIQNEYWKYKQQMKAEYGWCPATFEQWLVDKYIELHIENASLKSTVGSLQLQIQKEQMKPFTDPLTCNLCGYPKFNCQCHKWFDNKIMS